MNSKELAEKLLENARVSQENFLNKLRQTLPEKFKTEDIDSLVEMVDWGMKKIAKNDDKIKMEIAILELRNRDKKEVIDFLMDVGVEKLISVIFE